MPETAGTFVLTELTERLAKAEVYQSIQFAVNETLVATSNMVDAMPRVLRTIGTALGWQLGMYWMKTEGENSLLRLNSVWQSPRLDAPGFVELSKNTDFGIGESLPGRVWASGTPVWFTDFHKREFLRSEEAGKWDIRAAIAFPVYADLEVIGVLEFFSSNSDEKPDNHLLEVLTNVGYRIGQFQKKRQLDQQLRDANARFYALMEATFGAVIVANGDGIITEWNKDAEEMFGWRKSEALGRNLELIIPEQHKEAHKRGLAHIKDTDHTRGSRVIGKITDLFGLHKDGQEFPIQLSLATWNVTGNRFFGAVIRRGDRNA